MLRQKFSTRFCLALIVFTGAVTLLAITPGNAGGQSAVAPDETCANVIAFYRPYTVFDKAVYWTGKVVARDITDRADIKYAVPASSLTGDLKRKLAKAIATKIGVSLKGKDDYAVMYKENALKLLGDPKVLDFTADWAEMEASYVLVVSGKTVDAFPELKGKHMGVRPIISWKPERVIIEKKGAKVDPRLKQLIDKGVIQSTGLMDIISKCYQIKPLPTGGQGQ